VLWQLGVRTLIVTNAAGGVNEKLEPGDLVAINDHINFTGGNPLVGVNEDKFGPRFPDLSKLWTPRLRQLAHDCAEQQGVTLKDGVYAGVLGPNYETPAEVRMLRTLGADVVGMSTVYEAIVAGHMNVDLLGISCVTNLAAGVGDSVLDHDDVQAVAARAHKKFAALVDAVVQKISESE
jgi:purine-nucleoside phosphorylase